MQKLSNQSPIEYFRELVERAISRQHVPSSELSAFYLVNLLDTFVRLDKAATAAGVEPDQTLASTLCEAMASEGSRRRVLFKWTGDMSLFISGFFSDSLDRKLVDVDYYASLGGTAYREASRVSENETTAVLFSELSAKFGRFVDVLSEVSESSALTNNLSLLRLYEKWLLTGSTRSAARLRAQGVLPVPGSKRIH